MPKESKRAGEVFQIICLPASELTATFEWLQAVWGRPKTWNLHHMELEIIGLHPFLQGVLQYCNQSFPFASYNSRPASTLRSLEGHGEDLYFEFCHRRHCMKQVWQGFKRSSLLRMCNHMHLNIILYYIILSYLILYFCIWLMIKR